ncbi:MAG: four helix bundle protein [Prochloraceae cyanobacterium]|nr:four helix bundle protein [Prochloraceae cyanobacterium]
MDLIQKLNSLEFKEIWAQVDSEIDESKVNTTKLVSQKAQHKRISNLEEIKASKTNLKANKERKSHFPQKKERLAIKSHTQLKEYRIAFDAAMVIVDLSKRFPLEETYSLTDKILYSSRSVCTNLAAAWKQRDINSVLFVNKLNDCCLKITETQTWMQFAVECGYMDAKIGQQLDEVYNQISDSLVKTIEKRQKASYLTSSNLK